MSAAKGCASTSRSVAERGGHPRGSIVGVDRRRSEARVVLGGRPHVAVAQTRGECSREGRDARRRARVDAPLADERAAAPPDVGDRREVHVDAGSAQGLRGRAAVGPRLGGRAHVGRRARRGAGDAPHRPALLVDHDDERRAQPARPRDGLQAANDAAHLAGRAHVASEEDHARRLAASDAPAQRRRRREPVVGEDHVLADELAHRQRGRVCGAGPTPCSPRPEAPTAKAPGKAASSAAKTIEIWLTPRPYVLHHQTLRALAPTLLLAALALTTPAPATAATATRAPRRGPSAA